MKDLLSFKFSCTAFGRFFMAAKVAFLLPKNANTDIQINKNKEKF
nr:MAG TPA: hypothetical protein [Caudoviricetes sp.]